MAFNISQFAAAGLPLGGARNSHFQVVLDTPIGVPNVGARMSLTCKAAQIPASTLSSIPVPYFGRHIKLAGTRSFQPWQVTILNDEDFEIRHAIESWSNLINRHEANLRDQTLINNSAYRKTAIVTQFGKAGNVIRTYEFINLWPTEIGPIELSWDNGEQIQEFAVVFDYDYWRVVQPGSTGVFPV